MTAPARDQAHPVRAEHFVHVRIELYALPACGQTRAAPLFPLAPFSSIWSIPRFMGAGNGRAACSTAPAYLWTGYAPPPALRAHARAPK